MWLFGKEETMEYTPLKGTGVKKTREQIIQALADNGFDVCFSEYDYQKHQRLMIGKAKAGARREWMTYLPSDQVAKGKRGSDFPMEQVSVNLYIELDLEREEDVYFCPTSHKWRQWWGLDRDDAANKDTRQILLILIQLNMIKEDR